MKKLIAILITLVLSAGSLSISAFADEEIDEAAKTDFTNFTTITTEGIVDEPVEFQLLPDGYNWYDTEHKGTDMVIHYTTDVYEDGVTYEKFCRVYLPYGYDPDDKDTKYNVLYFQHGNSGSPNELFDHDMKKLHPMNLLNNIFDPDHQVVEPMIIVCPTFYLEYDEAEYVTPGDNPAGDGRFADEDSTIAPNYYREVVEDLIPAVESQLNVYCEDFSEEGIKATRDHRAWAGYSRGSLCTYYMFNHDLEYFKYWMPMSAPLRLREEVGFDAGVEGAYAYLKEAIDAHPDLDFFIYGTGGCDKDAATKPGTKDIIPLAINMGEEFAYYAQQTDTFSFGNDPAVNNIFFCRSEFMHNDLYMPYTLYNAATVLFK